MFADTRLRANTVTKRPYKQRHKSHTTSSTFPRFLLVSVEYASHTKHLRRGRKPSRLLQAVFNVFPLPFLVANGRFLHNLCILERIRVGQRCCTHEHFHKRCARRAIRQYNTTQTTFANSTFIPVIFFAAFTVPVWSLSEEYHSMCGL